MDRRHRREESRVVRANGFRLAAVVACLAAAVALGGTETRAQGTPYLVKDINQTGAAVGAENLLVVGDTVLFAGRDLGYGWELWRSDGTEQGTERVADIRPGAEGSAPGNLVDAGGIVYFSADDGVHGSELWRTDGTGAGTWLVADVNPGPEGSWPSSLVWSPSLGLLVFSAQDAEHGRELWASDGTAGGTFLLAEIEPGTGGSWPDEVVDRDGTIFFTVTDTLHGRELHASDGTPGGAILVAGIGSQPWNPGPRALVVFDGALFFVAWDEPHGWELWRCDDPAQGASVIDLAPGISGSYPGKPVVSNGLLYFSAVAPGDALELWRSDGTAAGSWVVSDLGGEDDDTRLRDLVDVGGTLYFVAGRDAGRELWKSDGTLAGTVQVKDVNAGTCSANPEDLVGVGARIFFEARVSGEKGELWVSDGTEAGTYRVRDIYPGPDGSAPRDLVAFGDRLLFTAIDGEHGREMWTSDGTEEGTHLVADLFGRNAGSHGWERLVAIEGGIAFGARTTASPSKELWRSDGSEPGTLVIPAAAGLAIVAEPMVRLGTKLVVWGDDDGDGSFGPWSIDLGTGTRASLSASPSGAALQGSWPYEAAAVGDAVFFTTSWIQGLGSELWRTDGTAAGTALVKDILPTPPGQGYAPSSDPHELAAMGGMLYFIAKDAAHGLGLWRSDGTASGTSLVKDFRPGSSDQGYFDVRGLRAVGEALFLFADDGVHGTELWRSDGTPEGTTLVADIQPGTGAGGYFWTSAARDSLFYFFPEDGVHGVEPWRSDGTPEGTFLLRDVWPGPGSSFPASATVAGDAVYFWADDGTHGTELWRTDGTPGGTTLLRDGNPNQMGAWNGGEVVDVNGVVYFAYDDGTHGHELWKTDGTGAGTVLAADVLPGAEGSSPSNLTNAAGQLFFVAFDPDRGREPWALTCGNGVTEASEACDDGAANGGKQSCCNGDCTRETRDLDGDLVCDRTDPSEVPLVLERVVLRRRTPKGEPNGSLLVVGSTAPGPAGAELDAASGIELRVRDSAGYDHATRWAAGDCRERRSGTLRCSSPSGAADLRARPKVVRGESVLRVRASVRRLDYEAPFAGPVEVDLRHGRDLDRTGTTGRCASSERELGCRGP